MDSLECKTLRERLGLTAMAFGLLLPRRVRERTVRYWESGAQSVPADAAALLLDLDSLMERHALAALSAARSAGLSSCSLIRYTELADLAPAMRKYGIGFHAALLGRTRELLVRDGVCVRIVGYDKTDCRAWLRRARLRDGESARATWAAST